MVFLYVFTIFCKFVRLHSALFFCNILFYYQTRALRWALSMILCRRFWSNIVKMSRPSSDLAKFREIVKDAKNVVFLTGAGVSAESGIPTFRDGTLWRRYQGANLANPQVFQSNPSLVWEYYHYRRELSLSKQPNEAHKAIAKFQAAATKNVTVITQNVDGLHQRAGSTGVLELHGSLFKTRCTKCKRIEDNRQSPICEGLRNRGSPSVDADGTEIPVKSLPSCSQCQGLLRPHIVWFTEQLDHGIIVAAENALDNCDLCIVVGTSGVVQPAASFPLHVAARGVPVAEFNIQPAWSTSEFTYYFEGPCGTMLPQALGYT